jgi:hypothetical protein
MAEIHGDDPVPTKENPFDTVTPEVFIETEVPAPREYGPQAEVSRG